MPSGAKRRRPGTFHLTSPAPLEATTALSGLTEMLEQLVALMVMTQMSSPDFGQGEPAPAIRSNMAQPASATTSTIPRCAFLFIVFPPDWRSDGPILCPRRAAG